ncbi:MAG: NAD(P)/FAD-dependent oxidoreductase [Candidatus Kapaibacterium sp.]
MMNKKYAEIAVIGSGPAGIAAAIQLKRQGNDFLLIEKNKPGGMLRNANLVENYPGIFKGLSGVALCGLMEKHLDKFDIDIHYDEVLSIKYDGTFYLTGNNSEISANKIIFACGTLPVPVSYPEEIPQEKIFRDVADILPVSGRQIAIVGGGDAAFDYALNLARGYNEVHILNRSAKTRCLKLLYDRAAISPMISCYTGTQLNSCEMKSGKIFMNCVSPGGGFQIKADYLGYAIGRRANTALIENISGTYPKEDIMIIGDAANGLYRQAAIAAGDGIRAAMEMSRQ